MSEIRKFPTLIRIIFTGTKFPSKQEVLELFVSVAKAAKSEGVMAIENVPMKLKTLSSVRP